MDEMAGYVIGIILAGLLWWVFLNWALRTITLVLHGKNTFLQKVSPPIRRGKIIHALTLDVYVTT